VSIITKTITRYFSFVCLYCYIFFRRAPSSIREHRRSVLRTITIRSHRVYVSSAPTTRYVIILCPRFHSVVFECVWNRNGNYVRGTLFIAPLSSNTYAARRTPHTHTHMRITVLRATRRPHVRACLFLKHRNNSVTSSLPLFSLSRVRTRRMMYRRPLFIYILATFCIF